MKVFWSWQSDTPGKTGRHFVRDAIEEAIQRLKTGDQLVEPDARDMEIDHDRKGVPGSPDLARTIFEKIDKATVFVADVTPTAALERMGEGGKWETKRAMNANVAIELGYALRAMGDEWILTVFNRHYGSRDDLPFDLKHKAGPIFFELAPDADKQTITTQRKLLVEALKIALAGFVVAARTKPDETELFVEAKTSPNTGVFFEHFEGVVETRPEDAADNMDIRFEPDTYFYIRLFPKFATKRKFSKQELRAKIIEANLTSFQDEGGGGYRRVNRYGAVCFEYRSNGGRINSLTQVFQSGEIWGLSKDFFNDPYGSGIIVPNERVEKVLWSTMQNYLSFSQNQLGLKPPFRLELGAYLPVSARLSTPFLGHGESRKFFQGLIQIGSELDGLNLRPAYDEFRAALYDAAGQLVPEKDAAEIT